MKRRDFIKGAAAAPLSLTFLKHIPAAMASTPAGFVVIATGYGPNSMDIQRKGTNRPAYAMAVNLYDRLLSYGVKTLPDGSQMYDYTKLVPEAAESWEFAKDGMSVTFKIRKGATFWDGNPITAEDVKWSFDRAVSVGGFPTVQMKAGLLEKPEQFEAVDASTFRIHFLKKSKLTMPDLGVPVPIIINSKIAKAHATAKDPWATDYLHKHPAGSGAYKLARWEPGQEVVMERFDEWKNGPLPPIKRVILREVPAPATRRALLERGDIDISYDVPPKDSKELRDGGKVKVVGVPIENSMYAVGLNVTMKPFDDVRVRKAVAYAIPYDKIFKLAAYERGIKMYGGKSFTPKTIEWPQPFPYDTDYDKARALLKEAGLAKGFEVPLSINLGLAYWMEPTALLIQESLGKVGINVTINKIPGASWRTRALVEKGLIFHMKSFGGWLNYPDYYFYWVYEHGHLFNSMNYNNPEVEKLVGETLYMPTSDPKYAPNVKKLIKIAFDEVPLIPMWQPFLDVAMQKNVDGYEYWFHRQVDCRTLKKV